MGIPKKVHIAIPLGATGGPKSLFEDPPLFCGLTGDYQTKYSRDRNKATCGRCKKLDAQYQEEVEYQKIKEKLAREQA